MSEPLVEVRDLVKHFPLTRGIIFQKQMGAVHAVDGVSFDVARGEAFGIVGETGCGKSTTARLIMRLLDPTSGSIRFDGRDIASIPRRQLKPLRREMQIVFQDPYSSLNPRKTVGAIIAEPFAIHDLGEGQGRTPARRAGADGTRRPQPRALQPLSAPVLGRPAPAHRRRTRPRPAAEADHRGRARLGPGRLDPGADPQPAPRAAAGPRHHADPDRARPVGCAAHVRPHRRHVPGEDRRAGPERIALRASAPSVHRRPDVSGAGARPEARRQAPARCSAGDVPSPTNPPRACRFHPRCPKAQEVCAQVEPPLEPKGQGTIAACHFPLTGEEATARAAAAATS